jgi:hypothetical protein
VGWFNREHESEAPSAGGEIEGFEGGRVPWAADRESIGRPVQGQTQEFDPGAMHQQAIEQSRRINEVLRKYGIGANPFTRGKKLAEMDPAQMAAMNQEIMEVMGQTGAIQPPGAPVQSPTEAPKFDIQMSEPTDPAGSSS